MSGGRTRGDGRRVALFDLDGTLLRGPSSERRFVLRLLRRGEIGAAQLAACLGLLGARGWRHGRHALKKNKGYLVGLSRERVAALAGEFVDELPCESFDTAALGALAAHRERGDATVLLSGTLQPVADAVAARLGLERAIGTLVPERAGRYASGLPTRHPFGPTKLALAERLCAERGIGLGRLVAYGDSIHDRFLLERVGEAVAVEPDAALGRLARRRRWRVLRHEGAAAPLRHSAI